MGCGQSREPLLTNLQEQIQKLSESNKNLASELNVVKTQSESPNKVPESDDLKKAQEDNSRLKAECSSLTQKLESTAKELNSCKEELQKLSEHQGKESDQSDLISSLNSLRTELRVKEKLIDDLQLELRDRSQEQSSISEDLNSAQQTIAKVSNELSQKNIQVMELQARITQLEQDRKFASSSSSFSDISKLQDAIKDKEDTIHGMQDEIKRMSQYISLYRTLSEENKEQAQWIQVIEKENLEMQAICNKYETLEDKLEESLMLNSRQKKRIQEMEIQLKRKYYEELGADSNEVMRQLTTELSEKIAQVHKLEDEIEELKSHRANDENIRNRAIVRYFINKMGNVRNHRMMDGLRHWKLSKIRERAAEMLQNASDTCNFPLINGKGTPGAALMYQLGKVISNSNPIMSKINLNQLQLERPLSRIQAIQLLDDILAAKASNDRKRVSGGLQPYTFPMYTTIFLKKITDNPAQNSKLLTQLMLSLLDMCKTDNWMGAFYARLMQIIHPAPIADSMCVWVTMLFKKFMDFKVFSKDHLNGGYVKWASLIQIIYNTYAFDPEYGLELIQRMCDSEEDQQNMIGVIIEHRLNFIRMNVEDFLDDIYAEETDRALTIALRIKEALFLWLDDKYIYNLLGNKLLNDEQMSQLINISNELNGHTVSFSKFITVVLELDVKWALKKVNSFLQHFPKDMYTRENVEQIIELLNIASEAPTILNKFPIYPISQLDLIKVIWRFGYLNNFDERTLQENLMGRDTDSTISTNSFDDDDQERAILRRRLMEKQIMLGGIGLIANRFSR